MAARSTALPTLCPPAYISAVAPVSVLFQLKSIDAMAPGTSIAARHLSIAVGQVAGSALHSQAAAQARSSSTASVL
jgi:hypothetical protein